LNENGEKMREVLAIINVLDWIVKFLFAFDSEYCCGLNAIIPLANAS